MSGLKKSFSIKSRKIGFTLAEVLITLTIVGVVAAVTMPTLISHHQKQVLVNRLKKSYATISNGIAKMVADEGATNLSETYLVRGYDHDVHDFINKDEYKNYLKRYFNTIENESNYAEYAEYMSCVYNNSEYKCSKVTGYNSTGGMLYQIFITLSDGQ